MPKLRLFQNILYEEHRLFAYSHDPKNGSGDVGSDLETKVVMVVESPALSAARMC